MTGRWTAVVIALDPAADPASAACGSDGPVNDVSHSGGGTLGSRATVAGPAPFLPPDAVVIRLDGGRTVGRAAPPATVHGQVLAIVEGITP